MRGAGYLLATQKGFEGNPGTFYDYVLGANGLFIKARNPLLEARICIAPAEIRGLEPVEEYVYLVHGKIPFKAYTMASEDFFNHPTTERYACVYWAETMYAIYFPIQESTEGHVTYDAIGGNTILEAHSHGQMPAFFSTQDTTDEKGFKLSLILGKVDTKIEYKLRLGTYGYYKKMQFGEVFDVHPQ
ncbi:MAG: Mov34/MPN/PAD-1 family protein [Chloroflexota bacterium]